jgi:hypothetical protein
VTNTEGRAFTFEGEAVEACGPASLYRGPGTYNGEEVIVGSVIAEDDSFAATAQFKDRLTLFLR